MIPYLARALVLRHFESELEFKHGSGTDVRSDDPDNRRRLMFIPKNSHDGPESTKWM